MTADVQSDSTAPPVPAPPPRRWSVRILWFFIKLYAVGTIVWWMATRYGGDRFWPATLLLFAPRWILLFPLALLAPAALLIRRRAMIALGLIALLIAGPIMGLVVRRPPLAADPPHPDLRILTLNTHFQGEHYEALETLVDQTRPDVVLFQEARLDTLDQAFGHRPDLPFKNTADLSFVISKYPLRGINLYKNPSSFTSIYLGMEMQYPGKLMQIYNVHLASPHNSLRETLKGGEYGINRLRQNAAARWNEATDLNGLATRAGAGVILAGDFNLPCDSPAFRTVFTELTDAFGTAGLGYGYTYRANHTTVRIDHVLAGDDWQCTQSWVGPDVGSPHRPLLADFHLATAGR